MKGFIDWISDNLVAVLLAVVSVWAIIYVVSNRKELFHK